MVLCLLYIEVENFQEKRPNKASNVTRVQLEAKKVMATIKRHFSNSRPLGIWKSCQLKWYG